MSKRIIACLLSLVMMLGLLPAQALASGAKTSSNGANGEKNSLRLWYDEPVGSHAWENRALPIGNGHIGGLTYGEIVRERLHVNEKTLWGGKPISDPHALDNFVFNYDALEAQRKQMDNHSTSVFPLGTGMPYGMGAHGDSSMGAYQDLGDIYFDFSAAGITAETQHYVRDLDMKTAVSGVSFDNKGVHYQREYFASFPDDVMVSHFTASEAGQITFTANLSTDSSGIGGTTAADGSFMYKTGALSENGEKWLFMAGVTAKGGTVTANGDGSITVTGADEATVYIHTDTDYRPIYPEYTDGRSVETMIADAKTVVNKAMDKGYEKVRADHVADHQELFNRVELNLGGKNPTIPTDELMQAYRNGDYNVAVEEMAFQMGRYLTIASSREGDELPSNLCGIWLVGGAGSYWGADFHFNVNVQMNYWPAYSTNLAECGTVFNDFMKSLVVPGRLTAAVSNGVKTEDYMNTPLGEGNGFMINTQVNSWGHTWPIDSQEYGWNIGGSSWAMQNMYDYWLYTGDQAFLEDTLYPMLKEMAKFWDKYLWWSDYQQRWVVGPSVSAEQGPTVNGTAYDQSIVWELYKMAITASELLGLDEQLRAGWQEKMDGLNPIIIGEEGQVKEWYEETRIGYGQVDGLDEVRIPNFGAGGSANQGAPHRHTSNLLGLFPGTLINKDTEEWMDAALKTLKHRTLNGTGWSKAMKINMYARTGMAEPTYQMIRAMCAGNRSGLLDNLLDSHPPFQIDGNFGLTAGMAEMLLQSQLGYTQFLPALPEAWATGSVTGLVSRGNFVIDMAWTDGKADSFTITSRNGGTFRGEYTDLAGYTVLDSKGKEVPVTVENTDRIAFETKANETYTIALRGVDQLKVQQRIAELLVQTMTAPRLETAKAALQQKLESVKDADALKTANQTAQSAIDFLRKLDEAKAFYDEKKASGENWSTALALLNRLQQQLTAGEKLLHNSNATAAAFEASEAALKAVVYAVRNLSANLTLQIVDGKVTMTSTDHEFSIRYTVDGNQPSLVSPLYAAPVALPQGVRVVKAQLFMDQTPYGQVKTLEIPTRAENVALRKPATSSDLDWGNSYSPTSAVDGDRVSRWAPKGSKPSMVIDLQKVYTIDSGAVYESAYTGRIQKYELQVSTESANGPWETVYSGGTLGMVTFAPTEARYVRYVTVESSGEPNIGEIEIYEALPELPQADKTVLKQVIEQAEQLKNSDGYANANAKDKEIFDASLAAAKVVYENKKSCEGSVSAAVEGLIQAMGPLGAMPEKEALEYLNQQLDRAKALLDTLTQEQLCKDLESAIQAAEKVKNDGTKEKYYEAAVTLENAADRTAAAEKTMNALTEAQKVQKEYTPKVGNWTEGLQAMDDLHNAVLAAEELLKAPNATDKQLLAAARTLKDSAQKVVETFASLNVNISVEGEKCVMTPSHPEFEIRYTLDGNTPSRISKLYAEPVTLPQEPLVIKAQMFQDGMPYGEVASYEVTKVNVALNKKATSPNPDWSTHPDVATENNYKPKHAVDGRLDTQWGPQGSLAEMELDLGKVYDVIGGRVQGDLQWERVSKYKLLFRENTTDEWQLLHEGGKFGPEFQLETPVKARYIRYVTLESSGDPNVHELEIYAAAGDKTPTDMTELKKAIAAAEAAKQTDYPTAHEEMQREFDAYLEIAKAVAANAGSDAETVAAATEALNQAIANLKKHYVVVTNGVGSGAYSTGDTVTITANAPAKGKKFAGWKVVSGKAEFADLTAATTTFPMPAEDVEITAEYADNSVTGVKLNKDTLSLKIGGTEQLIVTVLPEDAENKNVTWTSGDPKIATVEDGVVTAKRCGTVIIEVVTEDGGMKASCEVTVAHEYAEATCTKPKTCMICGATEGEALGHNMTEVAAKDATCTADGNNAYFSCDRCQKLFADKDGNTETNLAEVIIPATGHYYENGVCTNCGAKDPDYVATNKTVLEKTYQYALTLDATGVTDSAKVFFETAKAEAKAVLDDSNATQKEVDAAWNKLVDAIWGLGLTQGDKTMLEQLIAKAESMIPNQDKYVQDNWQQLVDALAAAKKVMADGNAMDEDIEPASKALLDAILAQRFKANKENLQDLIAQAEGLNLSDYTAESVAAFNSALKAAQAVMTDESLSEEEQNVVDAAVKQLSDAIDGLTAKPAPDPDETTPDKNPDAPATGDNFNVALIGGIMVLALAGVVVLVVADQKKKHI